jgi:hypothetical protein
MANSTAFSAIDSLSHIPECSHHKPQPFVGSEGSDIGSFIDDQYTALSASDYVPFRYDHTDHRSTNFDEVDNVQRLRQIQNSAHITLNTQTTVKPISKELFRKLVNDCQSRQASPDSLLPNSVKLPHTGAEPDRTASVSSRHSKSQHHGTLPRRDDGQTDAPGPKMLPTLILLQREIKIRSKDGRLETVGRANLPLKRPASEGNAPINTRNAAAAGDARPRAESVTSQPKQRKTRLVKIRGKNGQETVSKVSWPRPSSIRTTTSVGRDVPKNEAPSTVINPQMTSRPVSVLADSGDDHVSEPVYDKPGASSKPDTLDAEPMMSGGLSGKLSLHSGSRAPSALTIAKSSHASKSSEAASGSRVDSKASSSTTRSTGTSRGQGGEMAGPPPTESEHGQDARSLSSKTTSSFRHFADDNPGVRQTVNKYDERKQSPGPAALFQAYMETQRVAGKGASSTVISRGSNTLSSRRSSAHPQLHPVIASEASFEKHHADSSHLPSERSTPPTSLASRHMPLYDEIQHLNAHTRDRPARAELHPLSISELSRSGSHHTHSPASHSTARPPRFESSGAAIRSELSANLSTSFRCENSTIFAGKGWISPHPESLSSSAPQSTIGLPFSPGATMTYKDWITIQEQGLAAEYLQHPSARVEALSSGSRSRRDRIDLTRNLYARRGADNKRTIPESWANRSQTDSSRDHIKPTVRDERVDGRTISHIRPGFDN